MQAIPVLASGAFGPGKLHLRGENRKFGNAVLRECLAKPFPAYRANRLGENVHTGAFNSHFSYDPESRLTSQSFWSFDSSASPDPVLQSRVDYAYDLNDNLTLASSSKSIHRYDYDSLDRLSSYTNQIKGTNGWLSQSGSLGFDQNSNLVSYSTTLPGVPSAQSFAFEYQSTDDFLSKITNPLGQQNQYAYLANGKLDAKTLANQFTQSYGYNDPLGRLQQISANPSHFSREYTYNDIGNIPSTPRRA